MDEVTVGERIADQVLKIYPQSRAAEHHKRREAPRSEDKILPMNTRCLTNGTSDTHVAGTCRSGTQAPHDPPFDIGSTTHTR